MKYRKRGRTEIEISDIASGLWGMGGWSGSDDKQSLESLQLSIDLGSNFFDTAWAYGEGKSDGLLGQTIANNKVPSGDGAALRAISSGSQHHRCRA